MFLPFFSDHPKLKFHARHVLTDQCNFVTDHLEVHKLRARDGIFNVVGEVLDLTDELSYVLL